LLIDKRREILLPYIPFYYKEMYDRIMGNVDVEIIVSEEIDENALKKIEQVGAEAISIEELVRRNPKGSNVKIII